MFASFGAYKRPPTMAEYRAGYPRDAVNNSRMKANLQFYRNARASAPDGARVEEIHARWARDYALLERHHGYIQWLFPVFENAGMNSESRPLSKAGAAAIRKDAAASEELSSLDLDRVHRSDVRRDAAQRQ